MERKKWCGLRKGGKQHHMHSEHVFRINVNIPAHTKSIFVLRLWEKMAIVSERQKRVTGTRTRVINSAENRSGEADSIMDCT